MKGFFRWMQVTIVLGYTRGNKRKRKHFLTIRISAHVFLSEEKRLRQKIYILIAFSVSFVARLQNIKYALPFTPVTLWPAVFLASPFIAEWAEFFTLLIGEYSLALFRCQHVSLTTLLVRQKVLHLVILKFLSRVLFLKVSTQKLLILENKCKLKFFKELWYQLSVRTSSFKYEKFFRKIYKRSQDS